MRKHSTALVATVVATTLAGCSLDALPGRPSASTSSVVVTGPSGETVTLRSINTPGIVVDDMDLRDGQCVARVLNAERGEVLPDPKCTPGAIDPAVTADNLEQTICVSGYTTTVRPPTSATNKAKARSLRQYSMKYNKTIEYDHLVPLTLGGASTTSNLWPEPNDADAKGVNNPKDGLERRLRNAVCNGEVSLAAAQQAIATNWVTAEKTLGLK